MNVNDFLSIAVRYGMKITRIQTSQDGEVTSTHAEASPEDCDGHMEVSIDDDGFLRMSACSYADILKNGRSVTITLINSDDARNAPATMRAVADYLEKKWGGEGCAGNQSTKAEKEAV